MRRRIKSAYKTAFYVYVYFIYARCTLLPNSTIDQANRVRIVRHASRWIGECTEGNTENGEKRTARTGWQTIIRYFIREEDIRHLWCTYPSTQYLRPKNIGR
ncbi:uncharacterized protein LOC120357932 [Solenopsis invicta]|uniref:uncharacterized protein LOC120357932 n=1 Tax=Solenopsis invicta TaxID=13686 RepID=UPI00193E0670|nr:uncharacterized protein LOC120357932 [Solenopsis invicta]